MFPRDEELEEPDMNTLTTKQFQGAKQVRWQYGDKRPHPHFLNIAVLISHHKPKPVVRENCNRTLLIFQKIPHGGHKWRLGNLALSQIRCYQSTTMTPYQKITLSEISEGNYSRN